MAGSAAPVMAKIDARSMAAASRTATSPSAREDQSRSGGRSRLVDEAWRQQWAHPRADQLGTPYEERKEDQVLQPPRSDRRNSKGRPARSVFREHSTMP